MVRVLLGRKPKQSIRRFPEAKPGKSSDKKKGAAALANKNKGIKRRKVITVRKKKKSINSKSPFKPPIVRLRQQNEPGIQLIGYNRRENGLGESCRLAAEALQTAGIPFGIIRYTDNNIDRETDQTWIHKEIGEPRYGINIFHMNADALQNAAGHFGEGLFRKRYNVGYWHWELPDFPDEWTPGFNLVQEVWVPSLFVQDSVSRKSTVPVVRMPHCIQVKVPTHLNRASFGLPQDRFLFLSMFDPRSVLDRKNPMAAIEAFKLAFPMNDPRVGLVIKMNNPYPAAVDLVKQMSAGYDNIYILANNMERHEANALIQAADSVVSLHRAEGFGLVLAEGMYLGKPVIGTNWSGNTDFMNSMNSCPVDYRLVPLSTDYGPYRTYQVWAEPEIAHAAHYMRKLVEEPEWSSLIARRGQETIHTHFSPAAAGEMIRQRLIRMGRL